MYNFVYSFPESIPVNMGRLCVVVACNGTYQLERWKGQFCEEHKCLHCDVGCTCETPFRLFAFCTENKDGQIHLAWVKATNLKYLKTWRNRIPKNMSVPFILLTRSQRHKIHALLRKWATSHPASSGAKANLQH